MNKNIIKIVFGLGLVAILLIFLGVNYVPRISALTASQGDTSNVTTITRSDYRNEYFQRSIIHISKYAGSDWIERHPIVSSASLRLAGSDIIERHPISSDSLLRFTGYGSRESNPDYYRDDAGYYKRQR
jgi:hypothetical protein